MIFKREFYKRHIQVKIDLVKRKQELASISAQDEFAKWAKSRRMYDKLESEYSKLNIEATLSKASFQIIVGLVLKIAPYLLLSFIAWYYYGHPILENVSKDIRNHYFYDALSFPNFDHGDFCIPF
jgi:hypothetical protein